MTDDAETSREERCFRLWINSLGIATYVNNVFEDVRNGQVFPLFSWLTICVFCFSIISVFNLCHLLIFSLTFIDCDCPYFLLCRWVLLEVLDKVSPGSVNWKLATKPPIKMPFRKVENCNQVIKIGKDLNFSLVNVAGNDIVQGNKKLLLGECHFIPVLWWFLIGREQFIIV